MTTQLQNGTDTPAEQPLIPPRRPTPASPLAKAVDWVKKKYFLYQVSCGLYVLDWWENLLINCAFALLLWFVTSQSYRLCVGAVRLLM